MKSKYANRVISRRLIIARHSARLRQGDVAKILKCSQSRLSRVESGDLRITALELAKLAKVYEAPIEFFLKGLC